MLCQRFSPGTFPSLLSFFCLVFVAYFGVSGNLYEVENILLARFFFFGSPEKFERLKLVSVYIFAAGKSLPRLQ